MDNILGKGVCRCRFGAKYGSNWCSRQMAGFDLKISMDQVEQIELLAFVFMETFGLDREQAVRIDPDMLLLVQPFGKCDLIVFFDLHQFVQHILIIGECSQFFKLCRIFFKS